MGFKTDYREIILKDFCNLNCIAKHRDVVLIDYNSTTDKQIILSEVGCTIDDIPEIFADWYVEFIDVDMFKDASNIMNYCYVFTIREP